MRWAGHVACKALFETARRMRSLGASRRKWVDNIKTDVGEVLCDGVEQITGSGDSPVVTLVNSLKHLQIP
jgi:hypothetical protein